MVEQHGCAEKSLEQSVVQFVRYARTLFTTFFQTNIIFEVRLSLAGHPFPKSERCSRTPAVLSARRRISAAWGETIGVNGTNLRTSTSLMN